jgi:CshA-type fibril repeat protein
VHLTASAAVFAGALIAPAASASPAVTPPPSPSLTARSADGTPSAAVAVGDRVALGAAAPITGTGQTGQSIETTWNPAAARLTAGSVTAPEGWPVEYTTDGTTWSTGTPADPAAVRGVRTAGEVASKGYADGGQVSTTSSSGTLKQAAGSFQGSSGGDGWDVFFAGAKVLNVWHHNDWEYNLDCHIRTNGASCNDSVYTVPGYTTSGASSGSVVGSKVYSFVGETASNSTGVLCTNISTSPFTSCGYTPLETLSGAWDYLGSQVLTGTRVYMAAGSGSLLCFDTATSAACANQPYALPGFGNRWPVAGFASAVAGKVFVAANMVFCVDAATGDPCAGTWPAGSGSGSAVVAMVDPDGNATGVCAIMGEYECVDFTGASVTMPGGLATLLASVPLGDMYGWQDSAASTGTRMYWSSGGTGICYDWATDAACAGFTSPAIGYARYAVRVDPADDTCIWSNGDDGQITAFNGLTGESGCSPSDPITVLPYSVIVPRLGCLEDGRLRAWQDLTLTVPASIPLSALRVTVADSSEVAIDGFIGLTVGETGRLDLSSLTVASTGTKPTIEVTSVGASMADAAGVRGALTYTSDAPELCVDLTTVQDCPVFEPGVSATPAVAVSPLTVAGRAVATVEGTDVAAPLSVNVTRADMSGCLAGVHGTVDRTYADGFTGVAGQVVNLLGPDDEVLATATTDDAAAYSFDNVHPGSYTVSAGDVRSAVTLAAGDSPAVRVEFPVTAPTARPVSSTTLRETATTFPVDVTTDPVTAVNPASLQVSFGPDEVWQTTVTVPGEGMWEVVDGSLRFTPAIDFTGTTGAVAYRVADGFGTLALSTASVTVLDTPPTAEPVTQTGVQGDVLRLVPAGRTTGAELDPAATRLVDADGHAVTALTVAGVGEYAVSEDGTIRFTPVGTFSGSHTVVYRVAGVDGQTATSTITVTLAPIVPVAKPVTAAPSKAGTVVLTGVPDSATVTVPATARGASSVTYSGGRVVVTPKAGFSGVVRVPVTITNGTATTSVTAVVTFVPAGAGIGSHTLANGHTVVRWKKSATTSVRGYEVRVAGKKVCVTSRLYCALGTVLGPKATVQVIALGGDGTRSTARTVKYRASACNTVGAVQFGTDSAKLTLAGQREVKRLAKLMKAQGFTRVCLVGHTDSTGTAAYNKALSKRRVDAVASAVRNSVRGVTVSKSSIGERKPAKSNSSAAGQQANRRVEIGLR